MSDDPVVTAEPEAAPNTAPEPENAILGMMRDLGLDIPTTESAPPVEPVVEAAPEPVVETPPAVEPAPSPEPAPEPAPVVDANAQIKALREELDMLSKAYLQVSGGQPAQEAAPVTPPPPAQQLAPPPPPHEPLPFVADDEEFDAIRSDRPAFNKFLTQYCNIVGTGVETSILQRLPDTIREIIEDFSQDMTARAEFANRHRELVQGNPAFIDVLRRRVEAQNPGLRPARKYRELYTKLDDEVVRLEKAGIFPGLVSAPAAAPVAVTANPQQKPKPLEPRVGAMSPPPPVALSPKDQEMRDLYEALHGGG